MSERYALVVGISDYAFGLHPLPAAEKDSLLMRGVLRDYAQFPEENITLLNNPVTDELRQKLGELFSNRKPGDLVLFYYSGHGLTNARGDKAYLCSHLTNKSSLASTGISSTYLTEIMDECSAKQVLILDCCFSAMVANNISISRNAAILASCGSLEYSRSDADISVYTKHLVNVIKNGAATNGGITTPASLHRNIKPLVVAQQSDMTPEIWTFREGHDLLIARQIKMNTTPSSDFLTEPKQVHSPEINAYLDGILRDADVFQQRYVDLSATTIQFQQPLEEISNWSRSLIPSSFKVLDKHLHTNNAEPKILDSINKALKLHSQFVLLGAPGSGKTTSLINLQLDCAALAKNDDSAPIPIFVNLAEWADEVDQISGLIQSALHANGLPSVHVNNLLILFDGLNEVSVQSYVKRLKLLSQWLKFNPRASIVISCREKHYKNHKKLEIPSVHIEPFDIERIELFLKAYLGDDAAQEILPQLGSLQPELRSSRDLMHLAHNPFFLAMICYVYINQKHLPSSRGQLFQIFVETLYIREKEKSNNYGLSLEDLLVGLSSVAFEMQKKRSSTSMHTVWVKKQTPEQLSSESLLSLGRDAGLVLLLKNKRIFQFTHQLILEYFAAEGLLKKISKLSQYVRDPVFSDAKRKSAAWDEVIYTLSGILDSDDLLGKIAKLDPFLAVECFEHIPKEIDLSTATLDLIIQNLVKNFDSRDIRKRTATINTLVEIGTLCIPYLASILRSDSNQVIKRSCLQVLAKLEQSDDLKAIYFFALLDKNKWVRRDARNLLHTYIEADIFDSMWDFFIKNESFSKELRVFMPDMNESTPKLKKDFIYLLSKYDLNLLNNNLTSLIEDSDPVVREPSISLLSDDEINIWVDSLVGLLRDTSYSIRRSARNSLLRIDFSRISKRMVLALSDPNTRVRMVAVEVVGQSGSRDFLEKLVPFLNDSDDKVRVLAIRELSQSGVKGSIEKITFALDDANFSIRLASLDALDKNNRTEFCEYFIQALNDSSTIVRKEAARILKRYNFDITSEQFLSILNNPNPKIRRLAIEILGEDRHSFNLERLIPVLSNPYPEVKVKVIKILKKSNFNDLDENIIHLLNDRSPNVKKATLAALSTSAPNNFPERFVSVLEDRNSTVRAAAFNLLCESGSMIRTSDLRNLNFKN